MALVGIIRRWHIRDQIPLREIARQLGISRNTVRRYLRSEVTEPAYAERQTISAIDKVAVGTMVTHRPPHRSVLAALLHTAPANGVDAKPL